MGKPQLDGDTIRIFLEDERIASLQQLKEARNIALLPHRIFVESMREQPVGLELKAHAGLVKRFDAHLGGSFESLKNAGKG